uniref:Uncharacterized protein n=1 Tax=Rhizophora mucronata TaxID=61149 RepID=A0A2P2QWX1_RHIMU
MNSHNTNHILLYIILDQLAPTFGIFSPRDDKYHFFFFFNLSIFLY